VVSNTMLAKKSRHFDLGRMQVASCK